MFNSLGWPEIAVLLVVALFVVGPERLPGLAGEAGRGLRKLRLFVKGMTDDLKSELGPEFADVDLASLHPRTFVQKHLLSDDDETSTFDLLDGRGAAAPAGGPLGPGEPAPWDPDTT